jgi:hypothetical protein
MGKRRTTRGMDLMTKLNAEKSENLRGNRRVSGTNIDLKKEVVQKNGCRHLGF